MNINELGMISKQAILGVNTVINTYNNWRASEISKKNKLVLLLMECRRNLALLEILKLNENGDQKNNHLCQVAEFLDISVLSNCFMEAFNGDDSILQEINDLEIVIDTEIESEGIETKNRKASDVACFIYQRTVIIKSIADLGLDFQEKYNVHFKTRLKNIEKNIRILSVALASSKYLEDNSYFKK
jgi:hypothetical protein